MDSPGVQELWKAAGDSRLIVNVLCGRNNADAVARMLEKFARPPVVLDHCMNLRAGQDHDTVLADLLRIAKYPNAHAEAHVSRDRQRRAISVPRSARLLPAGSSLHTRPAAASGAAIFPANYGLARPPTARTCACSPRNWVEDAAKKAILGDTARLALFQLRPAARPVDGHGLARLVSSQVRGPAGEAVVDGREEDAGVDGLAAGLQPEVQVAGGVDAVGFAGSGGRRFSKMS